MRHIDLKRSQGQQMSQPNTGKKKIPGPNSIKKHQPKIEYNLRSKHNIKTATVSEMSHSRERVQQTKNEEILLFDQNKNPSMFANPKNSNLTANGGYDHADNQYGRYGYDNEADSQYDGNGYDHDDNQYGRYGYDHQNDNQYDGNGYDHADSQCDRCGYEHQVDNQYGGNECDHTDSQYGRYGYDHQADYQYRGNGRNHRVDNQYGGCGSD